MTKGALKNQLAYINSDIREVAGYIQDVFDNLEGELNGRCKMALDLALNKAMEARIKITDLRIKI